MRRLPRSGGGVLPVLHSSLPANVRRRTPIHESLYLNSPELGNGVKTFPEVPIKLTMASWHLPVLQYPYFTYEAQGLAFCTYEAQE